MSKVVPLHQIDSLVMPLASGATLRVTRFLESPRVAVTLYGPEGGNVGGVILQSDRARLLASWLDADGRRERSRLGGAEAAGGALTRRRRPRRVSPRSGRRRGVAGRLHQLDQLAVGIDHEAGRRAEVREAQDRVVEHALSGAHAARRRPRRGRRRGTTDG